MVQAGAAVLLSSGLPCRHGDPRLGDRVALRKEGRAASEQGAEGGRDPRRRRYRASYGGGGSPGSRGGVGVGVGAPFPGLGGGGGPWALALSPNLTLRLFSKGR